MRENAWKTYDSENYEKKYLNLSEGYKKILFLIVKTEKRMRH